MGFVVCATDIRYIARQKWFAKEGGAVL